MKKNINASNKFLAHNSDTGWHHVDVSFKQLNVELSLTKKIKFLLEHVSQKSHPEQPKCLLAINNFDNLLQTSQFLPYTASFAMA